LAVVAAGIRHISDEMLIVASDVLAKSSPAAMQSGDSLLPPLADIGQLSKDIAFAVSQLAFDQELAKPMADEALKAAIDAEFWLPAYRDYQKKVN
jgi:malate dehydrogenase (oxaloacetate-decarboxylating)